MTTPQIIASNADTPRFEQAHYSEALTAFTAGWTDPENLRGLLDFVAPPVPVARRFEFKRATNAEAFYSETDDARAIGTAFKRVEYRGDTVDAKTLNKGLTIRVDHDEAVGDDWQERYVQILLQRLYRNELRRAMAALDAAANSTDVTWDTTDGNPDGDLRSALIRAADSSGIRPNRLLIGETAWDIRADAYEAQQTAGAHGGIVLTPEALAAKLFVDGARVISSRYQSAATTKTALGGANVYAFYAMAGLAKDDPANLRRFVTPTEGGDFRVYLEEHTKYTDLTVEHYSNVIVTSDLGIEKLAVSAS